MTTSVTRPCFTIQYQTYKTDSKTTDFFWSETGLVPRPTVSDHITGAYCVGRLSAVGVADAVGSSQSRGSLRRHRRVRNVPQQYRTDLDIIGRELH